MNQYDEEARKKGACWKNLEDYYECLHHKKEVSMLLGLEGISPD